MNTLAAFFVISGIISSFIIGFDLIRHKQSMKIMNLVWILTGMWAGVLALIVYFWFGRQNNQKLASMPSQNEMSMPMQSKDSMHMDMSMDKNMKMARPHWQSVTLSTLHCGAGCTLADLIGEWFLYFVAIPIGGSLILGSAVTDYILALSIGIYFQYAAIRSMYTISKGKAFAKAIKADVLSLTAWQIGMYGFMAVVLFWIFPDRDLSKTSWLFWFMMQLAMLSGFLISFPANILLIKFGVKKAM